MSANAIRAIKLTPLLQTLIAEAIAAPQPPSEPALAEMARIGLDEASTVALNIMKAEGPLPDPGTPNRAVVDAYMAVRHYQGANDDYPKKFLRDTLFVAYAAKLMNDFHRSSGMDYHALGTVLRLVIAHRAEHCH